MNSYKALNQQIFKHQDFSLVPIRMKDKYDIMKWRNEQMYHLRQAKPLTKNEQNDYFNNVIAKLFDKNRPEQILFSYLENDKCIGYGGLVHMNWHDKNAEISFIMATELENKYFQFHWQTYLRLIEQVAFKEISFHKIFVYAFDLRPHLYKALEKSGYIQDARLKEHCLFNNNYIDIVIHSKLYRK